MKHGQATIDWQDGTHFTGNCEKGKIVDGQLTNRHYGSTYDGSISIKTGLFEGKGDLVLDNT